jgi:flagellar basal body-associated protein FliL
MAKYHTHFFSEKDKKIILQWCIAAVIFTLGVAIYFSWFFVHNCIFHWPIRWDIGKCWQEQILPAQQKAGETASPFVPL